MRRDRTGEVLEDQADAPHRCTDGWAGETADGRLVPCPTCRPHLVATDHGLAVVPSRVLTEKAWQQRVTDLATFRGWLWLHVYDSRRSTPGWPDLTLVRGGRLIAAELKTQTGPVTPEQTRWLAELGACPGVEAYLWRPSDWPIVLSTLT